MSVQPADSKIKVKKAGDFIEWEIPKKGTSLGMVAGMIVIALLLMASIAIFVFLRDEMFFPGHEIETVWILIGRMIFFGIPWIILGLFVYLVYSSAHTSYVVRISAGAVEVVRKFRSRETIQIVDAGDVYRVCLSGNSRSGCSVQVRVVDGRKIRFFNEGKENEKRWIASEMLTMLARQNALADPDDLAKHYLATSVEPGERGQGDFVEGAMRLLYKDNEYFMLERKTSAIGGNIFLSIIGFIVGAACLTPEVNVGGAVMIVLGIVIMLIAIAVILLSFNKQGTKEVFSFENDRILRERSRRGVSQVEIRFPKSDFDKLEIKSGVADKRKVHYSFTMKGRKDSLKLPKLGEQMYEVVKYKIKTWLEPGDKVFINGKDEAINRSEDEVRRSAQMYFPQDVLWYGQADQVIDVKRDGKGNVWGAVILGIIFLLSGVWIMGEGNSFLAIVEEGKDFDRGIEALPSVKGVIEKSELIEKKGNKSTEYKAVLSYKYRVDGKDYVGDDVDYVLTRNRYKARDIANLYPVGEEIKVFYGPNKPEISFIKMREGARGGLRVVWWIGWLIRCAGIAWIVGIVIYFTISFVTFYKKKGLDVDQLRLSDV